MTLLRRVLVAGNPYLTGARAGTAASKRTFSSQPVGDAPSPEQVARRNAIMGASLLGFVVGVFYYTLSQLRKASGLGPEFDEKLSSGKDCKTCEPNASTNKA